MEGTSIEERKNAEAALKESEERFSKAFHHNPTAMAISRVDGVIVDVSVGFERLTGFTRDEVIGKVGCDLGLYTVPSERQEIVQRLSEKGYVSNYEITFKHKSGEPLRVVFYCEQINLNGEPHFLGTAMDVTDRKKVEEALKEDEARLELAQHVAGLGSWEVFVKEDRAVWSEEMFNMFGLEPTAAPDTAAYAKMIHPEDAEGVAETMDRFLFEGKLGDTVSFDYRIVCGDGSIRYLHSERLIREVDSAGRANRILGIEQDITERKKAEKALREGEQRFRLVAEVAKVLVYEIELVNETIFIFRGDEILGYEKGEIPTNKAWWLSQIHPEDRGDIEYKLRQAMQKAIDYSFEYRIRCKQGNYIFASDTGKAVLNQEGRLIRFVGGMRDITERKKAGAALLESKVKLEEKAAEVAKYAANMESLAEERLRQLKNAESLAAIGATAGMVGHDIRNPLQAIISDVYLLKQELTAMPDCGTKSNVTESLDGIEKNIVYINKIVADLQDYAKTLCPDFSFIDSAQLITEIVKGVDIPSNIKLHINSDVIVIVKTDVMYIRRALTNLITNAIQAMPDGGNLTISVWQKNSSWLLTVEDTGVGIPEAVKPKLFTPMVTTKSKGQGLGLAVVKRLVEALDGTITFESEEDKGTKFTIQLPVA